MKFKVIAFLVLVSALMLTACGGNSEPEDVRGDPVAGQQKFTTTCTSCHGPDAKGMPGLGKDLTTSQFIKDRTNPEMVEFLKVGRSTSDPLNTTGVDMPPRGGNPAMSDADLLDIVTYVRDLQP